MAVKLLAFFRDARTAISGSIEITGISQKGYAGIGVSRLIITIIGALSR